jgi:hypothetical protein
MLSYLLVPGLRFNDCFFTEPVRLADWVVPGHGGIVAVLVRDSRWAPKPFQPLYFAEFGNGFRRLPVSPDRNLYVAVLPMPFSTAAQRRAARNELIASYNPVWQAADGASREELSRRLDALEARQEEAHAQILGMLSHLCKLFEPQSVAPRRPIGFLAEPAY